MSFGTANKEAWHTGNQQKEGCLASLETFLLLVDHQLHDKLRWCNNSLKEKRGKIDKTWKQWNKKALISLLVSFTCPGHNSQGLLIGQSKTDRSNVHLCLKLSTQVITYTTMCRNRKVPTHAFICISLLCTTLPTKNSLPSAFFVTNKHSILLQYQQWGRM
jgi:hypothetical protein